MDQKQTSSLWGIVGLVGCGILYVLSKQMFPALSRVLFWIFGVVAAGIILLVTVVLVAAFHKPKKTPEQEKAEARAAVLKQARRSVMELRTASMRVKDQQIGGSARQICGDLDRILKALQEQPEDIPRARSFLNHSLPLLSGILQKYTRLEQSGVPAEDVRAQTAACLQDLETAVQNQYRSLFHDDVVDITAEMQVLIQLCQQKGLLEDGCALKLRSIREEEKECTELT